MRCLVETDDLLPVLGGRDGLGVVTVLAAFTLEDPPVLWESPADLYGWLAEADPEAVLDEGLPKPRSEFLAAGPGLRVQVGDLAATLGEGLQLGPADPRRTRLLGPFDARWKAQRRPDLPEGSDPDYALMAPEAQRLPGYFRGDEPVRIQGRMALASRLPGIRMRAFVDQLQDGRPCFREVPLRAETLWLLPDRRMGGLLFRGALRVADPDLDDVLCLMVRREPLASPPASPESCEAAFRALDQPAPEAATGPEPEPRLEPGPAPAPTPAPGPPVPDRPAAPDLAALEAEGAALQAKLEATLAGLGLPPGELQRLLAEAPPPPPPAPVLPGTGPEVLEQALADLRTRMADLLPGVDWNAPALPAAAPPAPPPVPKADDLVAALRGIGIDDPAMEEGLRTMERARLDLEREAAAAPPAPEAGTEETGADAPDADVDGETNEAAPDRDFTGQDFTGQDLAGRDFSQAVLERACFRDAQLAGARFSGAVLLAADFRGARLGAARLDGVVAGAARFGGADLAGADLTGADCTGADLAGADLTGAVLDRALFNQANLEGARLAQAGGIGAEFQEARLARADLTGARLPGADCSGALLDGALLDRLEAPDLQLGGARGAGARFREARLPGARADADTRLERADFRRADLAGAAWAGAAFPEGQFAGAVLDQADLSRARLAGADLRCCRAREARFIKADLERADLRGADLFEGSLRQARLVDADLRDANLFGADCFRAVVARTRWDGANLKRTLLAEVRP
jgi:uncharacterized protein YjbI with pentapeptide repeats